MTRLGACCGLAWVLAAAPPADWRAGVEAAKRGECAAALAALRARAALPDAPGAVLNAVAVCESQTGHPERATDLFLRLARLAPKEWQAWNNLGANYLALGRAAEAEAAFRRAVRLAPASAQAQANLGRALIQLGRPREAFVAFDRAQQAAPRDQDIAAAWLRVAETLATQAADALERRQFAEARDLLRVVARPFADTASWHNLLGYAEFKLGNAEPALQHLQKALQLEPDSEDFLLDLGEFLAYHQAHERTLELFATAARRLPASRKVRYGLALAYALQNRRDEATRLLVHLLEEHPDFEAAYRVLGECYEDASAFAEMLALGRKLQAVNPRNGFGWYLEGRARLGLARQGDGALTHAIAALRQAVALEPEFARAHFQLARAYEENGQLEEAEGALRETLRLEPNHPRAHYVLGRLYQKLGQDDLARAELALHARMKAEDRQATYRRLLIVSRP
jgi:tetratricopeptide (TPR) repeat protein